MYNPYIPTEGWHSTAQEDPQRQSPPPHGLLEGLLRRFTSGGESRRQERSFLDSIPFLNQLDSGDLMLLLLLYFLYQETHDEDWLIILGVVLLSG